MNQKQSKSRKVREYDKLVQEVSPKSEVPWSLIKAFFVGGIICCIGQAISDAGQNLLMWNAKDASTLASVTLVFLASLLTALGVFDRIGQFAGAGAFVPITGFANAITAPAMEFRREGLVLGLAAKMFTIAGPVIAYGVLASVAYGVLYWALTTLL